MILELINNKVFIIKEAEFLPEYVSLCKKKFKEEALTFIYYMYNENSVYKELLPSQRRKYVSERHLQGYSVEEIEKDEDVQKFIDIYNEIQLSREERLRQKVQEDMDDLLDRLSNIKFSKTVIVNVEVEEKGSTVTKKVSVEIDNSKEKGEALKLAETLIELSKKLEIMVKGQTNKKKEQKIRLYDKMPKNTKR